MQPDDDEAPEHTDADAPPTVSKSARRTPRATKLRVVDGDGAGRPEWLTLLHRDDKGRIVPSPGNAAIVMLHDQAWARLLEYELRNGRTVLVSAPPDPVGLDDEQATYPREVIDADLVRLSAWFESAHALTCGPLVLSAAIDVVARKSSRDPVLDYLVRLAWDGVQRVDTWLHVYLGAPDDAYTRGVGPAWLISAVARTFSPGCQADHVLVLEGRQGIGKSSALRILAREPAWFADGVPGLGTKDAADALRGPWLIELGELDALQRAELATIKAFVSRSADRYREAYGRRTHDHPRRVVFAGSTNESAYLRDPTGSRRFWPVRCTTIDREALTRDRDQLWAESVARFQAGATWHPDAALAALASSAQEARYQADTWEGVISGYVDGHPEVTVREVGVDALKIEIGRLDTAAQMRIARALGRLGWTTTGNPVFRVVDGKRCRVRVYTPPDGADPSVPADEWGHP